MSWAGTMRHLLAALLVAATWLSAAQAQQPPVLTLESADQPVPLGDAVQYWIEATGEAIVDNVADGDRWAR